jgi:glycerol-3-phosphate acyltransferase PlsY
LIGGVPTAYIVTRLITGSDIRHLGDRNPGAANVYRNVGPKAGILVGTIDIVKGGLAVVIVLAVTDSILLEMIAGVAVLAGHNWPIHSGLRGGRGAATAVGVLLATLPILAIPVGAVALVVLYATKKATLAIGVFLIAVPVLAWPVGYSYIIAIYAVAIPVLVGLTHYFSVRGLGPAVNPDPEQGDEHILPQR